MTLPYERASTGTKALDEVEKILRRFGCSNFGVMNDWDRGVVIVAFTHREKRVNIEASWKGYAAAWLKENPYSHRRTASRADHEELARRKGELAVPSILRDWIKGQVTAVEIGLLPFEHAFAAHMLLPDGRRAIEALSSALSLEGPRP